MLLFAAQPAKLNITANTNTAFFSLFISLPPFLFENVDFQIWGHPHVPVAACDTAEEMPANGLNR